MSKVKTHLTDQHLLLQQKSWGTRIHMKKEKEHEDGKI